MLCCKEEPIDDAHLRAHGSEYVLVGFVVPQQLQQKSQSFCPMFFFCMFPPSCQFIECLLGDRSLHHVRTDFIRRHLLACPQVS